MENISELEAARVVCIRKIGGITQEIILLSRTNESIEEYEKSDKNKRFKELLEESKIWETHLWNIGNKQLELVSKI